MKMTTSSIGAVLNTAEKLENNGSVQKQTESKDNWMDIFITPVRKSAHFFEYMVLGILLFLFLQACQFSLKTQIVIALSFCFLYACSDEIHQLFVRERTGKVLDVLIDTLGASFGIGLSYVITKKRRLKHENSQ